MQRNREQEKVVVPDDASPPQMNLQPAVTASAATREEERKAAEAYYEAQKREEAKVASPTAQWKPLSPEEDKKRRVRFKHDLSNPKHFSQWIALPLYLSLG